jgi:NitT/TauT family transport system permease protein
MKRKPTLLHKALPKLLYIVSAIALWQALIMIFKVKEFVVPSPISVFQSLFSKELVAENTWWVHIRTTLVEIAVSFSLTALVGFFLALFISWSKLLRGIFMPVDRGLNSLPKIALAPLFLIWLGYGFHANVDHRDHRGLFSPVVLNTIAGLNSVDEDLLGLDPLPERLKAADIS